MNTQEFNEVEFARDVKHAVQSEGLKDNKGVLVLYTGGTIGSMPKDLNDPESPQSVVDWETFKLRTPELQRLPFRVDAWSLTPPLDSCNVSLSHWQEMADVIFGNYNSYEGFVILHGTDSMVYTATALSFMLVNLAKPVVITGAQRTHLFQARNDGLQNMLTAIELANPLASNVPLIPEVVLFFHKDILRGSRARKLDAAGLAAYTSPNFPPLGRAEVKIHIDKNILRPKPEISKRFIVRRLMEPNVVTFDVYPGIQYSGFVQKMLQDESLRGVIIRAFGSGNIPTDKAFLELFEQATKRGVTIQVVTQCLRGGVALGLYETSADLLDIGMLSGTDLTPEAALVKLMVALASEDLKDDPEALRRYLETNQVGEQSVSIYTTPLRTKPVMLSASTEQRRARMAVQEAVASEWDTSILNSVQLRLWDAKVVTGPNRKSIEIELYINLSSDEEPDPAGPNFAGVFRRTDNANPSILQFDITDAFIRIVDPGERPSFTVVLREGGGALQWNDAEITLFVEQR